MSIEVETIPDASVSFLAHSAGWPGGSLLSLTRAVAERRPERFGLRAESKGEALDGWQAPDAWATTKAAATKKPSGGYGNNADDEAEEEEEEEDDAASLAGLSLGALAAALYAKLF